MTYDLPDFKPPHGAAIDKAETPALYRKAAARFRSGDAGFATRAMALDRRGCVCSSFDPTAVAFCTIGLLRNVLNDYIWPTLLDRYIRNELDYPYDIVTWSDGHVPKNYPGEERHYIAAVLDKVADGMERPRLSKTQRRILARLRSRQLFGFTSQELESSFPDMAPSSVRTRLKELERAGLAMREGVAVNHRLRHVAIWHATSAGRASDLS